MINYFIGMDCFLFIFILILRIIKIIMCIYEYSYQYNEPLAVVITHRKSSFCFKKNKTALGGRFEKTDPWGVVGVRQPRF